MKQNVKKTSHGSVAILIIRCRRFSHRTTREICRSRLATRRNAHCLASCWTSVRITSHSARKCRRNASTRSTRSTLFANLWAPLFHETEADSFSSLRERPRSSSKSNIMFLLHSFYFVLFTRNLNMKVLIVQIIATIVWGTKNLKHGVRPPGAVSHIVLVHSCWFVKPSIMNVVKSLSFHFQKPSTDFAEIWF